MTIIDTLIHTKYLLPVEPMEVLIDHSVAIESGTIVSVLPTYKALKRYTAKETITLNHHILAPGLINMHTHSPMTLMRGLADDLKLMDWLHNHIWPAETAIMSKEYVYDGTLLACAEMIKSGTTCFNEHYFYPDIIANVAQEVGMRAKIGVLIINVKTAWAKNEQEVMQKATKLFDQAPTNDMLSFCLAPHSPYATSEETLRTVGILSKETGLPIHIHMHESLEEINISLEKYNVRPLARMKELGILTPRTQLVHMTQVNDADIQLVKEAQCHITHCPESNQKLASGHCLVQYFLDNQVNVCLGTDSAASNNDLDMIGEMRSAALCGKIIAGDPTAVSAENTLRMATINGARALGMDHLIGSISPNKKADLIAIDINFLNTRPLYNPISHLVYSCHSNQVTDVWVSGKRLLENGNLTTINEHAIINKAETWHDRLRKYAHAPSHKGKNR